MRNNFSTDFDLMLSAHLLFKYVLCFYSFYVPIYNVFAG